MSDLFYSASLKLINPRMVYVGYDSDDKSALELTRRVQFTIALTSAPILYFLSTWLSFVKTTGHSLLRITFIGVGGLIGWLFRILYLNYYFYSVSQSQPSTGIYHAYDSEDLNFEIYLGIGLLCGAIAFLLIQPSIIGKEVLVKSDDEVLDRSEGV